MNEAVTVANADKTSLKCDGINLVQFNGTAAGQDVFHFHRHIKPRWSTDDVVLQWDIASVDGQARLEMAELLRTSLT
jgi:histidine triad (HIT) family protein